MEDTWKVLSNLWRNDMFEVFLLFGGSVLFLAFLLLRRLQFTASELFGPLASWLLGFLAS